MPLTPFSLRFTRIRRNHCDNCVAASGDVFDCAPCVSGVVQDVWPLESCDRDDILETGE